MGRRRVLMAARERNYTTSTSVQSAVSVGCNASFQGQSGHRLCEAEATALEPNNPPRPRSENAKMWRAPQQTALGVERTTLRLYANHIAAAYTCRMKNPFRKAPMQQLETTIASLTKRGEQLGAKRVAAQGALNEAIKVRQQLLLSGDLDNQRVLDQVQGVVGTANSALAGIDDALAVLTHQKAEAERQLAAERERVKRAVAADTLTKQVTAIEAALPAYLEQSRALAEALSEIGHWHFESGQMAGFLQNTMGQIEVAANFTLPELKAMPGAIREGRQSIPDAPLPVEVTEPEVEMQIASQGVFDKSAPHVEPDPVLRAANFTVIDRSAEARTIPIDVPRS